MTIENIESVNTPMPKVEHSFVIVDPDTAQRWLNRNERNRNLRTGKVNEYARSMLAGHWTLSNDDICFGTDGKLLNGQHRLHAVVKAGVPVVMGVKRNVPPESMVNMDTGAARSPGDHLGQEGERNAMLLGSTLKQLILIDTARIYGDARKQIVSRYEFGEYLAANPDVRKSVDLAISAYKRTDATPTALAVAHFLIARVNGVDEATSYILRLVHRTGEPSGSPVMAVDSRLREMRRQRMKVENKHLIYLLIKGYNYVARNAPVGKLALTPKGKEFRLPDVVRVQR